MKQEPETQAADTSSAEFEKLLLDRVDSQEYAEAIRRLLSFVIPATAFAAIFTIFATGKVIFSTMAVIPMAILGLVLLLSVRESFNKKDFDPMAPPVPGYMQTLILLALGRGICIGSMIAVGMTVTTPLGQTSLLMCAIMGATLALTTNVRAISLAFGWPILFISFIGMVWTQAMDVWMGGMIYAIGAVIILMSASRARTGRVDLMRATLKGERAIQEQLDSEAKLRAAEQKAAIKDRKQQDITRQMQQRLIEAISFPVVVFHGDDVLLVTPETSKQFKLPPGGLEGVKMSDYFVNPEDQLHIRDILKTEGKLDSYEVLMKDHDGQPFWVAVSLRHLVYDNKDCWLNSIFNIDARKRMEDELAAAKEKAEGALVQLKDAQTSLIHSEKMASLGQLTAGIAHEIKNPLNFVNNFSKLAAEMMDELAEVLADPIAALDEEDREDAEDLIQTVKSNLLKIDEHGHRADSIVKNMLQHSREGTAEKQKVGLNTLAEEALNLAYHGARANDKNFNITLEKDLSSEVGEIDCIPQELQRVVLNLCTNGMYEAAKHNAGTDQAALLKLASRVEDDSYIVEVTDNGGGVPEEIRGKIFQPFFTTKPTGEGTGLGLSMSYDIIKQHKGLLSLESETGKGTTFRIRLPRS